MSYGEHALIILVSLIIIIASVGIVWAFSSNKPQRTKFVIHPPHPQPPSKWERMRRCPHCFVGIGQEEVSYEICLTCGKPFVYALKGIHRYNNDENGHRIQEFRTWIHIGGVQTEINYVRPAHGGEWVKREKTELASHM